MNCNKRAKNMSKRKLTDYFKPVIVKMLEKMLTVLFRMSQLLRLPLYKIRKSSQ